ncbi:hypothetical protein TNCV_545651 [Trichonephila clavipes]|nr:hypothetical protein TNCV_545651 [Trichonephila clavipes]
MVISDNSPCGVSDCSVNKAINQIFWGSYYLAEYYRLRCCYLKIVYCFLHASLSKLSVHLLARCDSLERDYQLRVDPRHLTWGCGSPVVKVSDHGRHVMSSSPVPRKTRRVGYSRVFVDGPRCLKRGRGEVTRTSLELESHSPYYHATPTEGLMSSRQI